MPRLSLLISILKAATHDLMLFTSSKLLRKSIYCKVLLPNMRKRALFIAYLDGIIII